MTRPDYVLKFLPNMHRAIWGEESWGVSVHRDGPGIIANGPLAGRPLAEVCPGLFGIKFGQAPDATFSKKTVEEEGRSVERHFFEATRIDLTVV